MRTYQECTGVLRLVCSLLQTTCTCTLREHVCTYNTSHTKLTNLLYTYIHTYIHRYIHTRKQAQEAAASSSQSQGVFSPVSEAVHAEGQAKKAAAAASPVAQKQQTSTDKSSEQKSKRAVSSDNNSDQKPAAPAKAQTPAEHLQAVKDSDSDSVVPKAESEADAPVASLQLGSGNSIKATAVDGKESVKGSGGASAGHDDYVEREIKKVCLASVCM